MPRKPAGSASNRSPWSTSAVKPEDLEGAKRDALLQLKIGRTAHGAAVVVSAALALDALLLLFLFPTLPALVSSDVGGIAAAHSFYLILPISGGVLVAAVGLVAKWKDFQFWPWEGHFSATVGAFALNVALVVVYALRVTGTGPFAHVGLYPWFLVLSLAGTSVALLAIVLTWQPWGARQWTSAVSAVAPVATALLLYVPAALASGSAEALAVALLVSAILYQTSGSFLHLLSSGTGAHEQAVVATGQSRIVRLAEELQQKEEAVRFREAALVKREADAETAERSLHRSQEALGERAARLQKLEAGHHSRAESLATLERELVGREASLEGQARALDHRRAELDVRAEELARQGPELAGREERLARHEGDQTKRDVELTHRSQDLDRREAKVAESEARFAARQREIDEKTASLLRREGDITARERGPSLPAGGKAAAMASVSADLAARETRAQHLKTLLDEQNVQLGRRAKEVAEQSKTAEATLRQIAEHQAGLAARERSLSQQEEDLQERLKAADERRLQFDTALRDYQQRLDEVGKQQVTSAQKGADLDRNLQSLAERERMLEQRESRLKTGVAELDRREGDLVLRERSVDADEAELSVRRQEFAREADLPFAGLLAAAADRADEPRGGGAFRGRRGRAPAAGAEETGTLAAPTARKYPDRLPTGTPRLDDLLLGGLPPKSHVMLVGDAFSGKEVALYAFIAEGLKRSEPVVLVTASRSVAEVSESLGVVLPQFRQYEQMGTVAWIDASGTGGTPAPKRLVAKNSDDRAGILTSLVQAAKQAEEVTKGGTFRVGFLGLSAVLAHSDERDSFTFLQNVVGILKPRNALAMYALEGGALSEAQVESLLGRMDGAIVFRQERDRTFLSVKGFGDVATRERVEVRATGRALVVGSFALERIR